MSYGTKTLKRRIKEWLWWMFVYPLLPPSIRLEMELEGIRLRKKPRCQGEKP